ncbi:beta-mannosidase [Lachnospiraceae bacterium ZAX-1]
MKTINLNRTWNMHEAPLFYDCSYLASVKRFREDWFSCDLPTDVRIPLIEKGIIKDPVLADYCLESEWIEKRSWWFVKEFDCEENLFEYDVIELVMDYLDTESDIFVNGQHIGHHSSVHYPFVYDIKQDIAPGKNEIAVRLSTGLEKVTDEQLSQLNWATCREDDNGGKYRSDYRRSFVRRPQYTVGWDWGPRVVTVGIAGDVYLRAYKEIAIRDVSLETVSIGEQATLKAIVNVENLDILSTKTGEVNITISLDGTTKATANKKNVLLTSGINFVELELQVDEPKLWWPSGYGDHPLYEVEVDAKTKEKGNSDRYPKFSYGIRTIKLDTSIIEGEHRWFQFIVNGKIMFAKGGDWIPNDSIYVRTTDKKIETLIDEAVNANFNMLRIWGGGLYERDYFYQQCDEKGLLLWHDFMFACTTYPDHQDWFVQVVQKELDYQTKRLRNHASLALLCGSNENHWLFNKYDNPHWGVEFIQEKQYGLYIANVLAKEIIYKNCPFIPYWNSSPYGGELPNGDTVGDVHRWHNGFMSKRMSDRIEPANYDQVESKFVSEYGYVGPCCVETIKEYMADSPLVYGSKAWEMHSNVFEKDTVFAGIEKQYLDHPEQLNLEDYVLYGGMVHGLMLGYSLEAIRFKEHCGGALFWMYNDTWGEIGWTIIDYYLRRKISYYGVKRAFAHVKLSIRVVDGQVVVQGMNDTTKAVALKAEYGYISFDGTIRKTQEISIALDPGSRTYVQSEPLPDEDYVHGTIMLIPQNEDIDSIALRMDDMRNLEFETSQAKIKGREQVDGQIALRVTSKGFAHGVYVVGDYDCSDNYFDILPGETKQIFVKGATAEEVELKQVR